MRILTPPKKALSVLALGIGSSLVLSLLLSCSSKIKENENQRQAIGQRGVQAQGVELIKASYVPAELKASCEQEIQNFKNKLNQFVQQKNLEVTFANSFGVLETATADFQDKLSPLTFMYSVSQDPEVRKVSQDCEAQSSQELIEIFSRRDIYQVLKNAKVVLDKSHKLGQEEQRLISETMRSFKLNGLELADDKLEAFKKLRKEISDLQTQFHANLNNNNDMAVMSEAEMQGVPESVRALFTKLPNNQYGISTKATYYVAFMENAVNPEARKKMLTAYENREAKKNTELMQKTISLKRQAAAIIGFHHWADYKTNDKMAKNAKTAWEFLQGLKNKLRKSYDRDYQALLALKKETDPQATKLDPWDGAYYSNQLRKRKYSLDEEVLREYFPADYVTKKMFEIYETLLNVRFVKVENAITWHPSVNLFEVRDEKTKELLAYFYTDMYPREGKYSHAAAFPLRTGRKVNGVYLAPISSIVANLTPPVPGKPSLLSHEEVDTLFHEFGHIMHMSLTRSSYASLSGSNVAWDFVEAPSQMLENWVWEPQILAMITQKYDRPSESMPKEMMQKLQQSRKFNLGWMNTRQLIFGIFDLTLHQSAKDLDVTETYKKIYKDLTGMDPLAETHFPATFGHIMGGYDAGYYGYLWSNVFAMDMFTKFQGKNLLSKQVGYKYRTSILEKGNTKEASLLLTEFLGRKPNSEAFFRYLGI